MASPRHVGSPLRDRLLSNSPDPVKSAILRDSGMGWNSPPSSGSPNANVSPLRIAKRDSPAHRPAQPEVARRTSSSFKHVRNNNLIPTAATPQPRPPVPSPSRRVSGEKRQRSQSMHDQAESENDRPFSYKRERRQSKALQGLIQKEPVTKSPFRQSRNPSEPQPPPPVPPTPSRIPVAASTASPTRSSLVSKRMHGPRLSGRRERNKTVTFDERCDVMEFSCDEDPSLETASDRSGGDDVDSDSDTFFQSHSTEPLPPPPPPHDSSYESIDLSDVSLPLNTSLDLGLALDPDASITGLVDSMFAVNPSSTPPRDFATDMETEDGVPFGRSHHATRAAQHHAAQEQQPHAPPPPRPLPAPRSAFPLPIVASPNHPPATPPRHALTGSPPLGRSTHLERVQARRAEEVADEDVASLPASPTPAPHAHLPNAPIPRFSLGGAGGSSMGADPFALPALRDEPLPDEDSRDVSMGAPAEVRCFYYVNRFIPRPAHGAFESPRAAPTPPNGRPRISREEVQRRMMRARSATPEVDVQEEARVRGGHTPQVCIDEETKQVTMEDEQEGEEEEEMEENEEEREEEEEDREEERTQEMEEEEVRVGSRSMSTELATVEMVEKRTLTGARAHDTSLQDASELVPPHEVDERTASEREPHHSNQRAAPSQDAAEFGLRAPGLGVDFGSRFGMGGLGIPGLGLGSSSSRLSGGEGLRAAERREVERVAVVDMDARSALDRLMDDVGGHGGEDASIETEEGESQGAIGAHQHEGSRVMQRAATDPAVLQSGLGGVALSRTVSVSSSSSLLSLPPPVPPKDNIRSREAMIIEKRREVRRFDEEGYDYEPPSEQRKLSVGAGRPSGRRSMSTGDVDELTRLRGKGLLDVAAGKDDLLGDSIEKELSKLEAPHKRKYHIRQYERMIYASSSDDRISHMAGPGDVDTGKAWKTVRRPSDMNEYSKQIKEFRAQQNPGKAYGKVFVRVIGVKGMHLPVPNQPTAVTCTLNNGIHFVTTPECALARDCRIEQEFELIEHSKLEFTLTLKVRRDPHIISQFKAIAPAPVQAPPPPPPPVVTQRLTENLARYLKPDGTLARAFIAFKDIATRCDTRLFETHYPLIGQRVELGGKFSTLQVGELVLQMFRLPPLPGIPPEELPQSLEECHRGLRHINWHKVTYFQGTLTQSGGDCSTWRRRQLRVIGANLVAFNDVTKKATATIDLKKAVAVEDDQEARCAMSPASAMTARSSRYDDYDGLYGVERSFRLLFPNDQEIVFFADTDEEKAKWLEVLRALLLWQRQDELSKRSSRTGHS
ncbi:hypothetical protein B0H10DRAFT_2167327 [Mycena sp. CBHHK59/15]|nr:hypothetical protein B0H10DRAFT_2167327 [Mycena sp. CBHHK59/15]